MIQLHLNKSAQEIVKIYYPSMYVCRRGTLPEHYSVWTKIPILEGRKLLGSGFSIEGICIKALRNGRV